MLKYKKLNEKIEKFCKRTYIALIQLTTAGSVLPSVLLSTVNYLIYDLKEESFQLPTNNMYANQMKITNYSKEKSIFLLTLLQVSIQLEDTVWLFNSYCNSISVYFLNAHRSHIDVMLFGGFMLAIHRFC